MLCYILTQQVQCAATKERRTCLSELILVSAMSWINLHKMVLHRFLNQTHTHTSAGTHTTVGGWRVLTVHSPSPTKIALHQCLYGAKGSEKHGWSIWFKDQSKHWTDPTFKRPVSSSAPQSSSVSKQTISKQVSESHWLTYSLISVGCLFWHGPLCSKVCG